MEHDPAKGQRTTTITQLTHFNVARWSHSYGLFVFAFFCFSTASSSWTALLSTSRTSGGT
jgi:hypothetical protein